jgi:hypothetical protein
MDARICCAAAGSRDSTLTTALRAGRTTTSMAVGSPSGVPCPVRATDPSTIVWCVASSARAAPNDVSTPAIRTTVNPCFGWLIAHAGTGRPPSMTTVSAIGVPHRVDLLRARHEYLHAEVRNALCPSRRRRRIRRRMREFTTSCNVSPSGASDAWVSSASSPLSSSGFTACPRESGGRSGSAVRAATRARGMPSCVRGPPGDRGWSRSPRRRGPRSKGERARHGGCGGARRAAARRRPVGDSASGPSWVRRYANRSSA